MRHVPILLITSPQGGSGKSTLAVNLAIHYAKQQVKVLLIHMAGYGCLPSMLKVPIRGTGMSGLITVMEQNEQSMKNESFMEYFREAVTTHKDIRNLHMLLSASPVKMESLTDRQTNQILEAAQSESYGVIIIDTSSELCQRNISCIERADWILLPTLQDVSSGWKSILFKEVMDTLNVPKEKVSFIVNRCSKYSGFNNAELEMEIGYSILGEIPEMPKWFQKYVNSGIPIYNIARRRATRPFQEIASKLSSKVGL